MEMSRLAGVEDCARRRSASPRPRNPKICTEPIFDAAFAQREHFTAEQLLDYARAIDDSVSRATVYRTLPIMTESALLREVDIGSGEKFYRPNQEGAGPQVASQPST